MNLNCIKLSLSNYRPQHTIFDKEKFAYERAKLGGLAQEGMNATGGTNIDWVIEHRKFYRHGEQDVLKRLG